MTLLVPEAQVREHVTMRACIDAVERAFAAAGRGHLELTPRRVVSAGTGARLHSLTAASDELGYVFSLTYSGTPAGADKNTTTVNRRQKVFTLFDAATGACIAILGGRYLSWLDTGAMGAVAIRHLAAPDASSLALIGSGRQARAALLGALEVRPLTDVRVWSRNADHARSFVAEFPTVRGLRAVASVREAVRDVEIVTTVTTAHEPVLLGEWLPDGVHVNSIGAHYPDRREVDTAAVIGSTVFVDTMPTASAEKGELLIPQAEGAFSLEDVRAELGTVVAGRAGWQRQPAERTFYASCGSAVEAFGAAVGALEHVRAADLPQVSFD
jgi:ornithine cyclodeaminase/alanine dehydrogenase-like protein (mu-crystallin family)